jgi:hypothetical protein
MKRVAGSGIMGTTGRAVGTDQGFLCSSGYHPRSVYDGMEHILKHLMVLLFHCVAGSGPF